MMFCFLCESGRVPRNLEQKGFVWIHLDCMMELFDFHNDFKTVKEILAGNRNESVEKFLTRMYEFDARWENSIKLIKKIENGIK